MDQLDIQQHWHHLIGVSSPNSDHELNAQLIEAIERNASPQEFIALINPIRARMEEMRAPSRLLGRIDLFLLQLEALS